MEPKILVIGRLQSVLDSLSSELKSQGRDIFVSTNTEETIRHLIETNSIDFVVMGAGLIDEARDKAVKFIHTLDRDLPVYMINRATSTGPESMIPFINQHAEQFIRHLSLEK